MLGGQDLGAANEGFEGEVGETLASYDEQWANNKYVQLVVADVIADEAEVKQKSLREASVSSSHMGSQMSLDLGPSSPTARYMFACLYS
jgi:hypothetical protein